MNTQIFSVEREELSSIAEKVKRIWEAGERVAFPTETVYGLGANGLDKTAAAGIYEAKGRPSDNPLILHVSDASRIPPLVKEIPEKAELLMKAFMPGPLTIIFRKADIVPLTTSGGLYTVAIRMPSHPVAHALLEAVDFPIAAPSANLSGKPSTTRASHVIRDLSGRVEGIVDGGDVPIGIESTIIDLSGERPTLLRMGYITREMLEKVIGPVAVDPAIEKESIVNHLNAVEHPKAPGMKYRHYAPSAPLTVVSGGEEEAIGAINALADDATGILTVREHLYRFPRGKAVSAGSLAEEGSIAFGLFDALRTFDDLGVTRIYSEDLDRYGAGDAVMNRLLKAAGGDYRSASELLN